MRKKKLACTEGGTPKVGPQEHRGVNDENKKKNSNLKLKWRHWLWQFKRKALLGVRKRWPLKTSVPGKLKDT